MKILNEKSLEEGYVYNVPYNEFIKEHAIPREMPVTAHFYLKKDLALWMDDKVLISDTMHGLYLQKGMNHVEYFDSEIQGIRYHLANAVIDSFYILFKGSDAFVKVFIDYRKYSI